MEKKIRRQEEINSHNESFYGVSLMLSRQVREGLPEFVATCFE
jgi:hypothetical protein